ncbi:MOSC domain-containing protein [Qipengyuania spongiae]|uniref:MOSC domain-containing protein n=1 Tax=Qipengyuania spongiae TaxID=2909673 RepID=A0ABY5SVN5_9SPHN|nr:MOSC domain-containing protein [Qipengyuania spongiae]UVI38618.1 MOSC domain-containing protein [Qipengyuania spongiae]
MNASPLLALCIGQPRRFSGEEFSAIDKRPVGGRVTLGRLGLEGDAVADRKHHGGPEMAVHHYARDHDAMWRSWLGDHPLLDAPAPFGENFATEGWTEENVHIGDRFRIGMALLEVSQPRKPCWKIEHRFGRKGMVAQILTTKACGWYYRVIEEGHVQEGDCVERVEIGHGEWSVARVFGALHNPDCKSSQANFHSIAKLARLSADMRERALGRLVP